MTRFKMIRAYLKNAARNEEGVTAIEYGLIAGLISILIVASATTIGTDLAQIFANILAGMKTASGL